MSFTQEVQRWKHAHTVQGERVYPLRAQGKRQELAWSKIPSVTRRRRLDWRKSHHSVSKISIPVCCPSLRDTCVSFRPTVPVDNSHGLPKETFFTVRARISPASSILSCLFFIALAGDFFKMGIRTILCQCLSSQGAVVLSFTFTDKSIPEFFILVFRPPVDLWKGLATGLRTVPKQHPSKNKQTYKHTVNAYL